MKEFLNGISIIVVGASVIAFFFGLIRLIFNQNDRAFSLKILLYSVIGFIIGFGTCAATFNMNFH